MVPGFDVTCVGEEVGIVEGGSGSDLRWVMMIVRVVVVVVVVMDLEMRGGGVCGTTRGGTSM